MPASFGLAGCGHSLGGTMAGAGAAAEKMQFPLSEWSQLAAAQAVCEGRTRKRREQWLCAEGHVADLEGVWGSPRTRLEEESPGIEEKAEQRHTDVCML